jgi:hypothetical protein
VPLRHTALCTQPRNAMTHLFLSQIRHSSREHRMTGDRT